MFGYKYGGLMETLLRSRRHENAAKWMKHDESIELRIAEKPFEVPMRRETYFAEASSVRWNR